MIVFTQEADAVFESCPIGTRAGGDLVLEFPVYLPDHLALPGEVLLRGRDPDIRDARFPMGSTIFSLVRGHDRGSLVLVDVVIPGLVVTDGLAVIIDGVLPGGWVPAGAGPPSKRTSRG